MSCNDCDKPLHGDACHICAVGLLLLANIIIWGFVIILGVMQ